MTGWGWWRFGQRWCLLWRRLPASVGWRCARSFASPLCLRILCNAILARKASGRVVLMTHSQVSFQRILHLSMPRKLNTQLLLFSDLAARFLVQESCFVHCHAPKPAFGHFRHIQGQAHVGLFQFYPTSLPCHSSRHVENKQGISCCL